MFVTKRIISILGDYWHPSDLSRDALEEALRPLTGTGEWQLEHAAVSDLSKVLGTGPDAVIIFKEDRELNERQEEVGRWMTDEIAAEIEKYVERGGAWIAWHSGLAGYDLAQGGDRYIEMLKGYFTYHPNEHQIVRYAPSAEDHAITQGIDTYEVIDEQYFVEVKEAETQIFLRSKSHQDGKSIAGWHHEKGEGKVVCFTPAHRREGLFHPATAQLLRNMVQWSCT